MTEDGTFKRRIRQQARATGTPYTKVLADRRLIESQVAFYDDRAPDYGNLAVPDRQGVLRETSMISAALVDEVMARVAPAGDVLELACGPGTFTRPLARLATTLTALDASPKMLARNQEEVGDPSITYVEADLFSWQPTSAYDLVFFGSWLSHVPPALFDAFWALVGRCLRPGGRIGFSDEDQRAQGYDLIDVTSGTPTARRRLADGRTFEIVKVFWSAPELEARLAAIGWDVEVRPLGDTGLTGVGRPHPDRGRGR